MAIKAKLRLTFILLGLIAGAAFVQSALSSDNLARLAIAQSTNDRGTSSGSTTNYPAFTLSYPSNWQKQEILNFVSPTVGLVGSPETINVVTEVLPTSNLGLANYTQAAMAQVESFQNFNLLNSSSTTLAGLPAHQIEYTYTDQTQTPLQNLQIWTVKDGVAYIISYGSAPQEFNSSLPALRTILDTFELVA